MWARSVRTATARTAAVAAWTVWLHTSVVRRSQRSTHTPAGMSAMISAAARAPPTAPAQNGEPVSAMISSGAARTVIVVPSCETAPPNHSSWN